MWHAALGRGTGDLRMDVAGGLVVARLQGGQSVGVDLESGATCAGLLGSSPQAMTAIDPYTARSVIVNGALVGAMKLCVSAVDLRTGEALWSRPFVGTSGDYRDEYSLRDNLQAVSAGGLDVIRSLLRYQQNGTFRFEEVVTGVEPATGAERWRRSVVRYPWGQSHGANDDIQLASDGSRVILQTPDHLLAFDGATGADRWGVPWPRDPARRVFVGAGHVLVARPGEALALRDTRDGSLIADIPAPGFSLTDAVVRRDSFVVAVEDAPGRAHLRAIDTTGRTLWKREAAYSIRRLRGLEGDGPSTVLALDGNGRLWAIDERTGEDRGGLGTGQVYDFAAAITGSGTLRVVLPFDGITAFDLPPTSRPGPLDPFVRWSFEERQSDRGHVHCHPSTFALVDGDDHVVWERQAPARLRDRTWGLCGDFEVSAYRRMPRYSGPGYRALMGSVSRPDAMILADQTGILVVQRKDGATLLDVTTGLDAQASRRPVFFDSGTFTLDTDPSCTGPATHAEVFAQCGSSLLYFNGYTALSIDSRTWQIEARSPVDPASVTFQRHETTAIIRLGQRTLTLQGVTYME